MATGNCFLNIVSVAQILRTKINKWDLLKLRSFCKAKNTVTKTKQQPTECEKIFTNPISEKRSPKYYKELKKLAIKYSFDEQELYETVLHIQKTTVHARICGRRENCVFKEQNEYWRVENRADGEEGGI